MARTKIKIRKITRDEDIDNLVVGDIVNLIGLVQCLYSGNNPKNDQVYIFLHKPLNLDKIEEFHIRRDQLFADEGGFIGFNKRREHSYEKPSHEYEHRDELLRKVGL